MCRPNGGLHRASLWLERSWVQIHLSYSDIERRVSNENRIARRARSKWTIQSLGRLRSTSFSLDTCRLVGVVLSATATTVHPGSSSPGWPGCSKVTMFASYLSSVHVEWKERVLIGPTRLKCELVIGLERKTSVWTRFEVVRSQIIRPFLLSTCELLIVSQCFANDAFYNKTCIELFV